MQLFERIEESDITGVKYILSNHLVFINERKYWNGVFQRPIDLAWREYLRKKSTHSFQTFEVLMFHNSKWPEPFDNSMLPERCRTSKLFKKCQSLHDPNSVQKPNCAKLTHYFNEYNISLWRKRRMSGLLAASNERMLTTNFLTKLKSMITIHPGKEYTHKQCYDKIFNALKSIRRRENIRKLIGISVHPGCSTYDEASQQFLWKFVLWGFDFTREQNIVTWGDNCFTFGCKSGVDIDFIINYTYRELYNNQSPTLVCLDLIENTLTNTQPIPEYERFIDHHHNGSIKTSVKEIFECLSTGKSQFSSITPGRKQRLNIVMGFKGTGKTTFLKSIEKNDKDAKYIDLTELYITSNNNKKLTTEALLMGCCKSNEEYLNTIRNKNTTLLFDNVDKLCPILRKEILILIECQLEFPCYVATIEFQPTKTNDNIFVVFDNISKRIENNVLKMLSEKLSLQKWRYIYAESSVKLLFGGEIGPATTIPSRGTSQIDVVSSSKHDTFVLADSSLLNDLETFFLHFNRINKKSTNTIDLNMSIDLDPQLQLKGMHSVKSIGMAEFFNERRDWQPNEIYRDYLSSVCDNEIYLNELFRVARTNEKTETLIKFGVCNSSGDFIDSGFKQFLVQCT